jgi:hypothetical protein
MALIVLTSVLSENTRFKGTCVIPEHTRQSSVYYIPVPEPSQPLPPFFALSRGLRTDECHASKRLSLAAQGELPRLTSSFVLCNLDPTFAPFALCVEVAKSVAISFTRLRISRSKLRPRKRMRYPFEAGGHGGQRQ